MKTAKTTDLLEQNLEYLKLPYIRESHLTLATEAASNKWDYTEFPGELIQGQTLQKRQGSIERRIKLARFPVNKTLADYDFTWPKKINQTQIKQLHRLEFIQQKSNVMFLGTVGLGKTHLAISLGKKACQQGYRVLYTTAIAAINALTMAKKQQRLKQELKKYSLPQLLLIDELGYLPIDQLGADLLFQIISERYEQGSIILTSNKAYKQWPTIFNNDSTITSAVLDRLLHHSETVLIEGNSYRMKDRIE